MFHRLQVTVPAIVAAITMSLGGAAVANAYIDPNYDPREQCSDKMWETYGPNCDGWHVVVINDSDFDLELSGITTDLYSKSAAIPAKSTDRQTLGRKSGFGGPANIIRLSHYSLELSDDFYDADAGHWWRGFSLTADFSGRTTPKCGVAGKVYGEGHVAQENIGCEILNPLDADGYILDTTQAVSVRYYPVEDGPWKK